MKTLLLTLLAATTIAASQAAPLETEDQALAVLQSGAPVAEKEAACLRLKEIGTAKSVPVLKALLADEGMAQWAVDALETMPGREAGDALLQALPETTGRTKALVIFALGLRREAAAVQPLALLASGSDSSVAVAATKALGKIGGEKATETLRSIRSKADESLLAAVNDALLAVANDLLAKGNMTKAHRLYAELHESGESPAIHAAIFRGLILSGGGASAIVSALRGKDEVEQATTVQLVCEFGDGKATKELAKALPKLSPLVQVAVLAALSQRNDPLAADAIAALVRDDDVAVRIAALKALGNLGSASHVRLLGELVIAGGGNERAEALLALVTLHRGDVTSAILAEVARAESEVKIGLVQALARRMDRAAVPNLLRLAAGEDARLGVAAIQALERLAEDSHRDALLGLITFAKDDLRRDAAVSAYVAVGTRSRNPAEFSRLALGALNGASVDTRCALLEAAGQIGGAGVVEALRRGMTDSSAEVRAAALRTLAESAGDEARPDLLKLAQEGASESDRTLALRGYWRLVEAMSERPETERFAAVKSGLAATKTPADQKLGLARLGDLRGSEALALVQQYKKDEAVRAEAEVACLQIAARAEGAGVEGAQAALASLAVEGTSQRVRSEAKAAFGKLDSQVGYLVSWLVSGPYRQEGKEAQQLFDVKFAPEGEGKAEWRALADVTGSSMDLLPVAGGNHCIVYLKTRVFCPKEQPVALEIGTDDGVKLWISGGLVHANNAVRGFTPGEDKAKATLKEGWNDFLLKVTQHTAGCAASVRVRTSDGKAVSGLRVEAKE